MSWEQPIDNGGLPITGYKIYRGTSSGGEVYLTSVTTTSYTDNDVVNGQTYYYYVTAVNSIGESGASNEVSVTPIGQPSQPQETTEFYDDFEDGDVQGWESEVTHDNDIGSWGFTTDTGYNSDYSGKLYLTDNSWTYASAVCASHDINIPTSGDYYKLSLNYYINRGSDNAGEYYIAIFGEKQDGTVGSIEYELYKQWYPGDFSPKDKVGTISIDGDLNTWNDLNRNITEDFENFDFTPSRITKIVLFAAEAGDTGYILVDNIAISSSGIVEFEWSSEDIIITETTNYDADSWYEKFFLIISSAIDSKYIDSDVRVSIREYENIKSIKLKVETEPNFIPSQSFNFDLEYESSSGNTGIYIGNIKIGGINENWLDGIAIHGSSILSLLSAAIEGQPNMYVTEVLITDIQSELHTVDIPDKRLTTAADVTKEIFSSIDAETIYVLSPVDIEVYDEKNSLVNNNENVFYSGKISDPEFVIIANPMGKYTVKVIGTDDGTYTLVMRTIDNGEVIYERIEENIPISKGETHEKSTDVTEEKPKKKEKPKGFMPAFEALFLLGGILVAIIILRKRSRIYNG